MLLLATPLLAGSQLFQTDLNNVKWQASSEKLHCSLSHDINLYGRATFAQSAGHELGFSMAVKQGALQDGKRAQLHSVPPGWHKEKNGMDLGSVDILQGKTPFQLNEATTRPSQPKSSNENVSD